MTLTINEDLQVLCVCTFFLFFKMLAVGIYTDFGRAAENRPAAPEDRRPNAKGHEQIEAPMSRVDRGLAMHRNDLENIPILLFVAVLLIMTVASPKASITAHIIYFVLFTFARLVHTLSYALSLQPWRSLSWGLGVLVTVAAGIQLLVQCFTLPALP